MLQQCPQTRLRPEAELRLREVQDNLAMHNLGIARFYYDTRYKHNKLGLKGAQDRLKEIVEKYPNFCLMDEVLFRWATTYQEEEEPDEAAKLYQRLVRDYPNSEFVEKAKDQLKSSAPQFLTLIRSRRSAGGLREADIHAELMQQISGMRMSPPAAMEF